MLLNIKHMFLYVITFDTSYCEKHVFMVKDNGLAVRISCYSEICMV